MCYSELGESALPAPLYELGHAIHMYVHMYYIYRRMYIEIVLTFQSFHIECLHTLFPV